MDISFACPKCGKSSQVELPEGAASFACTHCGQAMRIPEGAVDAGRIRRCLVCPSTDLYVRKDFPQHLGVALVAIGMVASSIAWAYRHIYVTFGILFATALADLILYALVGDTLMCYRCHAQYRRIEGMEDHKAFDLETHERYRQQAARAGS